MKKGFHNILCLVLFLFAPGAMAEDFVIKSVLEKHAENYLVEKENIRTFSERFKPFANYWAAGQNDRPARMTFRFPLEKPLKSAQLHANMIMVNSNNNKAYGSGVGHGSLWCSRDGKNWHLLLDAPSPDKTFLKGYDFHHNLPADLKGTKQVWVQVRLFATGMKDSTYSVAQFARNNMDDPNSNVFLLRVKHEMESAQTVITPNPSAGSQ